MENQKPLILEGPHFIKPSMIHVACPLNNVYWGTTPGKRKSVKSKMDGNEDFVSVVPMANGLLFSVADAHFGMKSGDITTRKLERCRSQVHDNPIRTLFEQHYALDQVIKEHNAERIGLNTATTLITGYLEANHLSWVNTGDSSLFLFRENKLVLLNTRRPNLYVGEFPDGEKTIHDSFRLPLDFLEHPKHIIYAHLVLSHICTLVNQGNHDHELFQSLLEKLYTHTGIKYVEHVTALTKTWNEANTIAYKSIPEWGQLQLNTSDTLIAVTDGICEPDEPQTVVDLEHALKTGATKLETGQLMLKQTLLAGGKDNATFLMLNCPQ